VISGIIVRPAREDDVKGIQAALLANCGDPSLFLRSKQNLRACLGDLVIAEDAGRVVGCAALHAYSPALAEVHSVAVLPECQGQGVGVRLVRECLERAKAQSFCRVFLGTTKVTYFARFGFRPFSRWELPSLVLLRKLGQVFHQRPARWLPTLLGRHTFMRLQISGDNADPFSTSAAR
jgi:N-acetylglutamate synthase-like GNAT family acetyltransferase